MQDNSIYEKYDQISAAELANIAEFRKEMDGQGERYGYNLLSMYLTWGASANADKIRELMDVWSVTANGSVQETIALYDLLDFISKHHINLALTGNGSSVLTDYSNYTNELIKKYDDQMGGAILTGSTYEALIRAGIDTPKVMYAYNLYNGAWGNVSEAIAFRLLCVAIIGELNDKEEKAESEVSYDEGTQVLTGSLIRKAVEDYIPEGMEFGYVFLSRKKSSTELLDEIEKAIEDTDTYKAHGLIASLREQLKD